jgi:hypothetical protein
MAMTQLFWGVDGRTHRLGPDGLALCRTQIDNSRPPEERVVSGCSVCDIVLRGTILNRPGMAPSAGRWLLPVAFAGLAMLLLWALLR